MEQSSGSGKVFFADKPRVMCELRDWAARLRHDRADVEKIGLFGSYATDTCGPRSDADLLIVLRGAEGTERMAQTRTHRIDADFPA
jgi:predicted nucleotidyltransferase